MTVRKARDLTELQGYCAGAVPRQVGVKVGGRGAAAYSIAEFQSTVAYSSDSELESV